MKRISVCGHFGFGKELLNGQTIKTKIITDALRREYGEERLAMIDTQGGVKKLPQILFSLSVSILRGDNIVILPAYNGLRVIVPFLHGLNRAFHRRIFYVVIGGWLPTYLDDKPSLLQQIKDLSGIFVETESMKDALRKKGFENVRVLPNCKELIIVEDRYRKTNDGPVKLCTFSRVMKEKGIEDAIKAVMFLNQQGKDPIYTLDIYGQTEPSQQEWFNQLMLSCPTYIQYKGLISFDRSTEVLKDYFALLFPTYHSGEGFAGTLIDAMAAGLPVIASDWRYNAEIVQENQIGCLVDPHNTEALADAIRHLSADADRYAYYRSNCLSNAHKYLPENAIRVLIDAIGA